MKIEDIELCATYWTVSGAVYPGAPSEVSPFPLQDRAEVSGRVGWRGMGFVLDDMEASIARYGLPTVRRIFADNGIRHVELEFLCDWHLDGDKRLASDAMYDRLLEVGAELGIGKIKVGGGVFEEGEPDLPAMRATFAKLCERAAPLGIDIVIEFLPFASINTIDRGIAILDGLGTTNGGLLVDTWHVERGGMTAADIRKLPLEFLRAVELDDAGPEVMGSLFDELDPLPPPSRRRLDRHTWTAAGDPRRRVSRLLRGRDHRRLPPSPAARDRRAEGVRRDDAAVPRRQPARGLSRRLNLAQKRPRLKDEETPMVGIAVLGAGRIGKIHAASVAANPRATLVAIADPFPEAVEPLAKALGAEAMSDPMAAIARSDVDAVVIGTPTDTHVALLLKAVELGKAVLCEKPIDLDIAQSESAAAEVERVGGKVMLAFNRRFDSSFAAIRRAIDEGRIGEVRQVVITSRDPGMAPPSYIKTSGGIFRDMTIHDLDMARWLLGEEPVLVSAFGSRLIDPTLDQYDDYDTAMVVLQTASGKQAHINNCREAVYGYDQRVEVFGATGMLSQDNLRASTIRVTTAESTDAREPLLNFFLERYAQAYRAEMEAFIDALAENKPMPTTVRDGVMALRLAECAVESVRTGRAVAV